MAIQWGSAQVFIDFNKVYGLVGREVLRDVLTEFGIPTIIRLI